MLLQGLVYFVVNEGEIVYSTYDEDSARNYAYNRTQLDMEDTAEDMGLDIDIIGDNKLAEVALMSGFDGGYYYVDSVDIPEESDVDEDDILTFTFETDKGDRFDYNDLVEVFDTEVDDYDECDTYEDDDDI